MWKRTLIPVVIGLGLSMSVSGPAFSTLPAAGRQETSAPRVERLEQDLQQVITRVQPLLRRYGYLAVFLAILVEGVGIPAPGQTFLIAAALAAAHGSLSLVWVLIWASAAAMLGNSLGYLLGRWGGRPLLARFKVRGDRLARLENQFRHYGGSVVLVARFFDGLRQLNGIVAGMLAMPWNIFTLFNVLGAIFWTGFWGVGAYWLDREISTVHRVFRTIEPFVAAFTLLGLLTLALYLFRRRTQPPPPGSNQPRNRGPS
jgi:membrane protein DedA with SNARE-associated domain